MLDSTTKKRIDDCRDILVGKVPDPKSQIEQITIALIYKFMDDMDREAVELGGKRKFFSGKYEKYAWQQLFAPDLSGDDRVKLYGEAIEKMEENPNIPQLFRDIFNNAYLPYRDPETLREFLKYINDFRYDHSEQLGDAFEYLLSVLGSQGDAGQFRTPRHIIDFMVELVDPQKQDTILDPACGTAGFLISAYKHILKQNSSNYEPGKDASAFELHGVKLEEISAATGKKYKGDKLTPDQRKKLIRNFQGYDISPDMVRLSLANMYLHGFTAPQIIEYDALTSEDRWDDDFDVIMANPPFMSPKGGIRPHNRFSISSKRSEVLFVDYIMDHLNTRGRAAVIVPEGIIFQTGTAYKSLRKKLVDENFLVGVISLPAGVFNPYSGVKTSILWIDRELAKKTDDILFVKVENDGFDLGAQRRPIKQNDLPEIFQKLFSNKKELTEGAGYEWEGDPNLWTALKAEIGENGDYNLSGERYKDISTINSEYDLVRLGEVFETSSGGTPSKSEESYWKNGTIPWLKSGEVAQGYITSSEQFITEEGLKNSSAKLFPPDSVLVAMYGATAGQVGLLKFEASTNQAVCAILPNKKVKPEYLYYLLKARKDYLVGQSVGGAQPNISQTIIRNLEIPLPPLSVQEEIVAEIEGYQKIIDGARMVVDNYQPRIDIDPDWPMVELGEVFEINYGLAESIPKNLDPNGIKIISTAETNIDGSLDLSEIRRIKYIPKYDKYLLNPDTLLFNWRNAPKHVGKTVYFNETGEYIYASFLLALSKKIDVNSLFFWAMLNQKREEGYFMRMSRQAVNQTNFNATELAKTKLPLAPREEQDLLVDRMLVEMKLVDSNKKLLEVFNTKIRNRIAKVWGTVSGAAQPYPEPEGELRMVAEDRS